MKCFVLWLTRSQGAALVPYIVRQNAAIFQWRPETSSLKKSLAF